jgi:hypothetical protein
MFILINSASKHIICEDAVKFQKNKRNLECYHTVFTCLGRQFCYYFASRAFDPSGRVHCCRLGGVSITDGVLRIEADETVNRFTLEFAD